jgi:subtilisin family serine protease
MNPLELIKVTALMERTSGRADIVIGLLDGPVATHHPNLAADNIREVSGKLSGTCTQASSTACVHGTFVAGVLCARRGSAAPALCPMCTLLVRPIFAETTPANGQMPSATPAALAAAIIETVDAGARVLNVSAALAPPSTQGERELSEALDYAARHGVIVVVAAGNQGTLGSSAITRHPWVIPVVACDLRGRPLRQSNIRCQTLRWLRAPCGRTQPLARYLWPPFAVEDASEAASHVHQAYDGWSKKRGERTWNKPKGRNQRQTVLQT